jgi:hypothetical protein
MVADFKKDLSEHDVIRNKLRYIKNLLKLPDNIIKWEEEEDKKKEQANIVNEVFEQDETAAV